MGSRTLRLPARFRFIDGESAILNEPDFTVGSAHEDRLLQNARTVMSVSTDLLLTI